MIERVPDMRGNVKITDIEGLVPQEHLLRKIDRVINFERIYGMVEHLYSEDNGRPAADPVVLVKMAMLQHLYGIRSLRQTVAEIDMNIAYRWFLHYDIDTPIPHFATVSYAFATRFPSELFEEIFAWILEAAVEHKLVEPRTVFIDATHIKASANKKKNRKVQAQRTARIYDEQLRAEIALDREAHGKKPLRNKDNDDDDEGTPGGCIKTESTTDPDCGMFRKGEHKVEFAYTTHVACDEHNFILSCEVTAGNVHDSTVFDGVYDDVEERFGDEVNTVAVDAGYKTPWICKKVQDAGKLIATAYKRPMTKEGFFKSYEYHYDAETDTIMCPNGQTLRYSTTNREGYREYRSCGKQCSSCPYLNRCTMSRNHVKIIQRHIWEGYVEEAERFRRTDEGKASYSLRSQTIERVFADAKEKHGMRYTLHRGLDRVRNWVRLKFAAMNLKKLAMWA